MPICVTGVPGSGISLVSTLLHGCGLSVSPAEIESACFDSVEKLGQDMRFREPNSQVLTDLKMVVCLRNPLEVAQSRKTGHGEAITSVLSLWQAWNQRLMGMTTPKQRLVTHFDSYFRNPRRELRRLIAELSHPASNEDIEQACKKINPGLRHQRLATVELLKGGVSAEVRNLYVGMCKETGPVYRALRAREAHSTLGSGFYTDEGNWRWMSQTGHIHILSDILPAEIYFELSCNPPESYKRFPLDVRIILDDKLVRTVTFRPGETRQIVEFLIPQSENDIDIRLESSEFFVPSAIGKSLDNRQLSVRLSKLRVEPLDLASKKANDDQSSWLDEIPFEEDSFDSLSQRDCPLCANAKGVQRKLLGYLDSDRHLGPKRYHLVLCSECDLVYLSPLPGKEVFDDLYVNNEQFTECACYTGTRERLAMLFYGDRVIALLTKLNAIGKPVRVLEVGSGLSWMSRAAKYANENSLTVAQDISSETSATCKWVDHFVIGELSARLDQIKEHGPYEIISMTHVIEHLPDPVAVLSICKQVLSSNGIIFVTAPHRPKGWSPSSPISVWQKWSFNHVPAHLQYFNEKSMRRCSDSVGLEMVYFDSSSQEGEGLEVWLSKPQGDATSPSRDAEGQGLFRNYSRWLLRARIMWDMRNNKR